MRRQQTLSHTTARNAAQDKILEETLAECCELVGRFVVPESYLPHMLSRIKEEPEVNPTRHR